VRKSLILDTSVLLYDKNSIHSFPGNDVILPFVVLDELDRFKDKQGILGESARHVNRYLDDLRGLGRLDVGVHIVETDQTIRVMTQDFVKPGLDLGLDITFGDNRIISTALKLKVESGSTIKVITKDINLRVKCDALGIAAEDYYKDHISIETTEEKTGVCELQLSDSQIDRIFSDGSIVLGDSNDNNLFENCYVVAKSCSNKSALCVYKNKKIHKIKDSVHGDVTSITPKNKEQTFAMHALSDLDIDLVCLTGIAGSGKTFLTLASALDALHKKQYDRIVFTRSIQPVGREMGFLPGDMNEKMHPWIMPLIDNFRHTYKDISYFNIMIEKGQIDIAPLSYIRGRTFNNSFIIVDEAQNATIHELKTVITRVGKDSKIVLLGDTDQIDTPYIDKRSNGLSVVSKKLAGSKLTAHVNLSKGERSDLATLASLKL